MFFNSKPMINITKFEKVTQLILYTLSVSSLNIVEFEDEENGYENVPGIENANSTASDYSAVPNVNSSSNSEFPNFFEQHNNYLTFVEGHIGNIDNYLDTNGLKVYSLFANNSLIYSFYNDKNHFNNGYDDGYYDCLNNKDLNENIGFIDGIWPEKNLLNNFDYIEGYRTGFNDALKVQA